MKKSKFSEHQIIAILKAVEAGRTVRDVCRETALQTPKAISRCVLPESYSFVLLALMLARGRTSHKRRGYSPIERFSIASIRPRSIVRW